MPDAAASGRGRPHTPSFRSSPKVPLLRPLGARFAELSLRSPWAASVVSPPLSPLLPRALRLLAPAPFTKSRGERWPWRGCRRAGGGTRTLRCSARALLCWGAELRGWVSNSPARWENFDILQGHEVLKDSCCFHVLGFLVHAACLSFVCHGGQLGWPFQLAAFIRLFGRGYLYRRGW